MYLLFDIGGTNLRVALSDGNSILSFKIVPTPKDFDQGIEAIKQIFYGEKIDKIVGGIAGPLNSEKSELLKSPHLPGWVNKPLKEKLQEIFCADVLLENDTALVGLSEAVSLDKKIVAYIGIGTGIGGVRIVNNIIDHNSLGFEPGHQIIEIDGKLCNCGGKGHLEAYVGGAYVGRNADWDSVARYLSIGLNNTIVHWSPDVVVLGGSVMQSLSIEKIKSYLEKDLTIFPILPEIIPAKLGNEGGLYGALSLLL